MDSPLYDALGRYPVLSLVGMSKNAGKTTVLNYLLGLLARMGRVAGLTSIGRDGETTDIVTGTEKPGIWVREGSILATAADMLRHSDITREILDTTGMYTPLGEVVFLRALSDGFVQLAGPSMNDQLARVADSLRAWGAETVLLDGAVSRRSLAAPAVSGAAILCAGASYHPDMDVVIADTAHVCRLLSLPASEGEHARRRLLPGAATDAVVKALLLKDGDEITVRDGSRLLISRTLYDRLAARGVRCTVLQPGTLCCVCVNPISAVGADFDAKQFQARMAAAVPVPVIDVEACDGNLL